VPCLCVVDVGGEKVKCSRFTSVIRSAARTTHHRNEATPKDHEILQRLFNRMNDVPLYLCSGLCRLCGRLSLHIFRVL